MSLLRTIGFGWICFYFFVIRIPKRFYVERLMKTDEAKGKKIAKDVLYKYARRIMKNSGATIEEFGRQNVPQEGPVLYIANHRSFYDVFSLYQQLPNGIEFIAKDGLGQIPQASAWFELSGMMFLQRGDTKHGAKVMLKAIDELKRGYSVAIFPEGTRGQYHEVGEFKSGFVSIAKKAKCKIVPIALKNTEYIQEMHSPWITPAEVKIRYGEPIDVNALDIKDKDAICEMIRGKIQSMYDEL